MREIKFRAWHKGFNNVRGRIPAAMLYDKEPGDCLIWARSQPIEAVMQFTGLCDKNGTVIYEGDIVGRPDDRPVCWENGEALYRNGAFRVHAYVLCELADQVEVIGNIYESPSFWPPPMTLHDIARSYDRLLRGPDMRTAEDIEREEDDAQVRGERRYDEARDDEDRESERRGV